MNGLSLTNTRDLKANSIYLNYDNDIKNILEIFSLKNEITNSTDLTNLLNLKAPINNPTFTGTVSGITKDGRIK